MSATFDPVEFHERAVQTPSHEDVGPLRSLLCGTLRDHGVEPHVDETGTVIAVRNAGDGTPNRAGGPTLDGDPTPGGTGRSDGDPHLVLNTHIDTVPPHVPFERRSTIPDGAVGGETDPSDGSEPTGDVDAGNSVDEDDTDAGRGDVVVGRGACDAKGSLAAFLDAFLGVDVAGGRVTLAVTPDEETDSTGAAALDLDADAYVVGEPTGLDVCTAAKGRFEGTITVRGESAHAAEPASGANAIRGAGAILTALGTYDDEHGPGAHDSLGDPTLTPTRIRGGDAPNQVPETCRITVDRRSVPPETADGFRRDFGAFLRELTPPGTSVEFEFVDRPTPFLEPFATPPDEPLVRTLRAASGGTIRPFVAATEASYFAREAPTVVFGPGVLADDRGAVAHSRREYVRVSAVRRAAEAVRETLAAFVGPSAE